MKTIVNFKYLNLTIVLVDFEQAKNLVDDSNHFEILESSNVSTKHVKFLPSKILAVSRYFTCALFLRS